MSRRRRALALGALSALLGAIAVSDVAGREAALARRLGPIVPVVVARVAVAAGASLGPAVLAVRRVPRRFAPRAAVARPGDVTGLRAAVRIPAGTDLSRALLRDPAALRAAAVASGAAADLRPGERAAEVVARGDAASLHAGSRIDLLVTRESADGTGTTRLALRDAEVLSAAPLDPGDGVDGRAGAAVLPGRVVLSLRVTLREAVALAAAQNFAKEIRVLVRVPGDRRPAARGPSGAP